MSGLLPGRKLTADQVSEIRSLNKQGLGYQRLAMQFSVSQTTIMKIVKGLTWKEV